MRCGCRAISKARLARRDKSLVLSSLVSLGFSSHRISHSLASLGRLASARPRLAQPKSWTLSCDGIRNPNFNHQTFRLDEDHALAPRTFLTPPPPPNPHRHCRHATGLNAQPRQQTVPSGSKLRAPEEAHGLSATPLFEEQRRDACTMRLFFFRSTSILALFYFFMLTSADGLF